MGSAHTLERPRTIREAPSVQPRQTVARLLGAAFLVVILTSLGGGLLLDSALGPGDSPNLLQHLSTRLTMARAGVVLDLVTSCGIVVLAALLYIVLHRHGRAVALVALGCWLTEAIFMAISRLGALALVQLSGSFVDVGAPSQSAYQILGGSLAKGLYAPAYTVHMFFYCIGGLLWYGLFYRSRSVPRVIALWGLLAAALGLMGIVVELFGASAPTLVFLPLLGFELAIGFWLLTRGVREEHEQTMA